MPRSASPSASAGRKEKGEVGVGGGAGSGKGEKRGRPMRLLPTVASVVAFGAHFWWIWNERARVTALEVEPYTSRAEEYAVFVAGMTGLYFALVFVGPWLVTRLIPEKSAAFDVDDYLYEPMVLYNYYQSLLNAFMVWGLTHQVAADVAGGEGPLFNTGSAFGRLWGRELRARDTELAFFIWLHFHDKFCEFCDTLFMVLRRKNDQLSFLHVVHHAIMPWAWYLVLVNAPTGDCFWGSSWNSFVHVVMYLYYGLRAMGVSVPWKKAVTQLQLVQFVCVALQSVYLSYLHLFHTSPYPLWLALVQFAVMTFFFVLFLQFSKKKYGNNKRGHKADKKD